MRRRPLIFIIISFLFLFPYNVSFDVVKSVIPGTHPELGEKIIYNLITFIWFVSVSYLYRLISQKSINVSITFFKIHVFFSLLPLLSLALPFIQFYFQNHRLDTLTIENIGKFDNIYYYIGLCFLLGQVTFTAILLFRLISSSTKDITQQ
jgi:hypothetical protein